MNQTLTTTMDKRALIEWFVFGRLKDFGDANVQQEEKDVPLIDLTVDEDSNLSVRSTLANNEEARSSNEEEPSTSGPLQKISKPPSDSSSSDGDADNGPNARRVQPRRRAHLQQKEEEESWKEDSSEESSSDEERSSKRTSRKAPQTRPVKKSKQPFKVVTYSQLKRK